MKIYTRTGDSGETGLFGGSRIDKDAERVEAYGTLDELNSVLGLVLTEFIPKPLYTLLHRLQSELFAAGAELASTDPNAVRTRLISQAHVRHWNTRSTSTTDNCRR